MKKSYFVLLLLLCAVGIPRLTHGQESPQSQVTAQVYFHIGTSVIDPEFMSNGTNLQRFVLSLKQIQADTNYVVSRVVVVGTASPDGNAKQNNYLAGKRAQALADYLKRYTSVHSDKIEIVNGGENWAALRMMMEGSDMPYRDDMLRIMDRHSGNRDSCKHTMMFYADSKPWLWMAENFFPDLRSGAGNTQRRASLNTLSRGNWQRMREIVRTADIDAQTQQALLNVIDNETDVQRRLQRMQALYPDSATYMELQTEMIAGLLRESSVLSADNWTLLREQIAGSDIPSRDAILHTIDNTPITNGREQALKALEGGEPYHQILNRFLPQLLVASSTTHVEDSVKKSVREVSLRDENWNRLREMVLVSNMPDQDAVLTLIDQETDPVVREQQLRSMNNGETSRYINEVFFPELLYGISPATQENWAQLNNMVSLSDLPRKSEILEIIRTTSPGLDREQAIRALDEGESWHQMGEMLLPKLLSATEPVSLSGSGLCFSYELSPAAQKRASVLAEQSQADQPAVSTVEFTPEQPAESASHHLQAKSISPFIALKTDLMLWGGVMPGFEMGPWIPNLSAEIYFARRWSVELGGTYSNWNAFSGDKGLYAVMTADLEARHWFGKRTAFQGCYLGVYGQYGQYDVQQSTQGQTGSFWCAGLGVGWMQPLSRHWAIDAEIRGGYRSAQNEIYDIEEGHSYFNNKQTDSKFTPQLRVQVVYRFGKTQK